MHHISYLLQLNLSRESGGYNMKLTELLGATMEELKGRETELKREMFNLRFQQAVGGSLENPMRIRNVKREIARIKTVVQQRKAEG